MVEGVPDGLGIDFFRSDLGIYTCHHVYLVMCPVMSSGNWVTGITMAFVNVWPLGGGRGVKKVRIAFVFFLLHTIDLRTWFTQSKNGLSYHFTF